VLQRRHLGDVVFHPRAIWNIATTNTTYHDPGADYFTGLNPQKAPSNAVRQLEAMGYRVTLDQAS